jgi:hypothetical protein
MDRMGVDLSIPHQEREPRSCHDINGQTVHLDGVPVEDGDLIPAASPSQMTPSETEASELDMDRIIQSFIRQQARPGEGQVFEEPSYHALPGPTVPVQTPGNSTPSIVPGYNDAYFDAQFDDDMLFGFNGSVQDSILYQ